MTFEKIYGFLYFHAVFLEIEHLPYGQIEPFAHKIVFVFVDFPVPVLPVEYLLYSGGYRRIVFFDNINLERASCLQLLDSFLDVLAYADFANVELRYEKYVKKFVAFSHSTKMPDGRNKVNKKGRVSTPPFSFYGHSLRNPRSSLLSEGLGT